jgi:CheY-like chemotaxis protein/HD-like signal output (HDOD) protein
MILVWICNMKDTVLVVDDMPIIRDPIAATLTAAGYRALRAGDGKQALDLVRAQPVDLILLDVNMPVMDGLAFLRLLRGDSSTSKIPVIMLSGAEDRQDILQAAKLGIEGYVLKSHFSLKDLLGRVTRHFHGPTPKAEPVVAAQHNPILSVLPSQNTDPSAVNSSSDKIKTRTKSVDAIRSSSSPPRIASDTSSFISREQCIERAKAALQGRTLSGVVAEVITLATSPRGDASDLTALISRDPILAARILQAANSSANASTRGSVSTLAEAVRNIGCAAVRNIAAALGVFNAMPESASDGFNLLRCWQHAFAVATLCNRLSSQESAGLAYLVGLCHDLGEILFHSQFAGEYQQVLEIQQSTGKPRDEIERKVLGMSQGELLQTIVDCLQLPNSISAPIREYHAKGSRSAAGTPLTRILRAADLYANGMLLASSNQSPVRPITCVEAKGITGHENPPLLDRVAMRGEILALTATLSRFSEKQQREVMTAPYPKRPFRVWLACDPSLSTLDPVQASLELLADVTRRNTLPSARDVAEHEAIIVQARSTSESGFSVNEVKQAVARPNGEPVPLLWLVGRVDSELRNAPAFTWPIPLAKVAEFIASVPLRPQTAAAIGAC